MKQFIIKKINKGNLNTKTFYSEDGDKEEVIFKGETLTFTLQLIKSWTIKRVLKFKSDSFWVGGGHRSATTKIYEDITSKIGKVIIGYSSLCNRKKAMTVSDNTIQTEGLGIFP